MKHAYLTLVLASAGLAVSPVPADARPFRNNEIIVYSPNYPAPGGGTQRALLRVCQFTLTSVPFYTTTTRSFAGPSIEYDAAMDRVIFWQTDVGMVQPIAIDSDGNETVLDFDLEFAHRVAATGAGPLYFANAGGFRYSDGTGPAVDVVDDATGLPIEPFAFVDEVYYDEATNSLFYEQSTDFGPGIDEDVIVKLELSETDPTRVVSTSQTEFGGNPDNLDKVTRFSPGPDGSVFFSLDVNNNDVWPRAQFLDPETLGVTTYASAGFFRAAGIDFGVYSPVTADAVFYTTAPLPNPGFVRYDLGDVDSIGVPAVVTFPWVLNDMLIVRNDVCLGDYAVPGGQVDFFDALEYFSLLAAEDPRADLAVPFGSLDFFDVLEFLSLIDEGCP